MIRKSVALFIVVIHFLAPYSMNLIKNTNVYCQCGCGEWPCYCCQNSENSCEGTSVSRCKCGFNDDSDIQSPATLAHPPVMGFALDRMGHIICSNSDLTLPGYKDPPMKPPPAA